MTIKWQEAVQSLQSLSAGERDYWGPTLDRLQSLEGLDPDYVLQKMAEFQVLVEQPVAPTKSSGELSREVIHTALEQLRKVLRGAEFDSLQLGDLQLAGNRAAVWRKLASLNQEQFPPLLMDWDLRTEAGSWADLGDTEWHRARFIRGALAYLQVRNPNVCTALRLALAKALEKTGKSLRKELETLELRCQRELGPDDAYALQQVLTGVTSDA